MGIKKIKENYNDLTINLVDIINILDPSFNNKYTEFLTKEFVRTVENNVDDGLTIKSFVSNLTSRKMRDYLDKKQINKRLYFYERLLDLVKYTYNNDVFDILNEFNNHLENERIPKDKRDINQYDSLDSVIKQNNIAELKQFSNKESKNILIVYEDDDYLFLKPLSFNASLKYGSKTKWCTASKNNPDHFYRYSKNGVLIYIMDKKNGDKYALYYDIYDNDFSIWSSDDKRIDSIITNIPSDIIKKVLSEMKTSDPNYDLFTPESKKYEENLDLYEVPSKSLDDDFEQTQTERMVNINEKLDIIRNTLATDINDGYYDL
jgi:hypothetical protein